MKLKIIIIIYYFFILKFTYILTNSQQLNYKIKNEDQNKRIEQNLKDLEIEKKVIKKLKKEINLSEYFNEKMKQKYLIKLDKKIKELKNNIKNFIEKIKKEILVEKLCKNEMINLLGNNNKNIKMEEDYYKKMKKEIIGEDELKIIKVENNCSNKNMLSIFCKTNGINVVIPQTRKNRKIRSVSKIEKEKVKNFERSDYIRFALRKYFCDFIFNKIDRNWKNCKNENCEINTEDQNKQVHENIFLRNNNNIEEDFKFTIHFPNIFEQLWKLFGNNSNDLLISLTFSQLEGFDNPAKSGANFFTSWDGNYFLKSVLSEPKWYSKIKKIDKINILKKIKEIIESDVEKDFFFSEEKNKNNNYYNDNLDENKRLLLTPLKSPYGNINENYKKFKGAFLKYFNYLIEICSPIKEQKCFFNGKGGTLLPKFFLLFTYTPLNNLNQSEIYSIQNGLFPEGNTPTINLIFDLKGSKRKLLIKEGLEKLKKNGKSPNWLDLNFIEEEFKNESFFPDGIKLDKEEFKNLKKIIEEDSKFLKESNIIDYSLLLGVHILDDEEIKNNKNIGGIKAFFKNSNYNNIFENNNIKNNNNKELRLFIGIIDILQPYINKKQFEGDFKNLLSFIKMERNIGDIDYPTASITNPETYQERFVNFITTKVFNEEIKEN